MGEVTETFLALIWCVFGLGFFILMVYLVLHQHNVDYDRRLNEMREFGRHVTGEDQSNPQDTTQENQRPR